MSASVTAQQVVRSLKGRWLGGYGMVRCPAHPDKTPSCKVADGQDRPVFHCFAGCDWRAIVGALESSGVLPRWEPSGKRRPPAQRGTYDHLANILPIRVKADRGEASVREKRAWAAEIWKAAAPVQGTLGEVYLRNRGITIPLPRTIRFTEKCWNAEKRQKMPALVIAFQTLSGEFDGVQRIYLDRITGGKAPLIEAKLTLGTSPGSAMRMGEPRKPTDTSPLYGELGLTEGSEDALSVMQMFGVPVWATGGGERISLVELPSPLESLFIYGDNGGPGKRFARKAVRALHPFAVKRDGVPRIFEVFPNPQHDDFNTQLREAAE